MELAHVFAGSIGTMIWGSCITFIVLIKKTELFTRITRGQYVKYLFITLAICSFAYTIFSLLFPIMSVLYHGVGSERLPYLVKFACVFLIGYAVNKSFINRISAKLGSTSA